MSRKKVRDGFGKKVLTRFSRGDLGVSWLKRQFLRLAESCAGFTYETFVGLCKNSRGQIATGELLFQMRLLWCEWIEEDLPTVVAANFDESPGLPTLLDAALREVAAGHLAAV